MATTWCLGPVLVALLAVGAACSGDSAQSQDSFVDIEGLEVPVENLEGLGPNVRVLVADLIEVRRDGSILDDPENAQDNPEEVVTLVFEPVGGPGAAVAGRRPIEVRWLGYATSPFGGDRVLPVRYNGVAFTPDDVGSRYLIAVERASDDEAYSFVSTSLIAAVDDTGGVRGLGQLSEWESLGVARVPDLERLPPRVLELSTR